MIALMIPSRRAPPGLCRRPSAGETPLLGQPIAEELADDARNLLLDERHDVAEFLETRTRLGRSIGGRRESALGDLAHLAVDGAGAREHRIEGLRRSAEVLAAIAPAGGPPDQPGVPQQPGRSADRAAAR